MTAAERQRRRIAKLAEAAGSDITNPALAEALAQIDRLREENTELRRRLAAASATAGGSPSTSSIVREARR